MPDITDFTLKDTIELSAMLRSLGSATGSMEESAEKIVRYLYDHMTDPETGERNLALVRFFKTHPYRSLDPGLQEFARGMLGGSPVTPDMRCLVLLASVGDEPSWNSRQNSQAHRAIPLPDEHFVRTVPMVEQLILQMGLDIQTVIRPDPAAVPDIAQKTFSVFSIPDASDNPYVPDQNGFVRPYGIKSVIGFGGMLPSGNLFAIIFFSKVAISPEIADLFRSLPLSVKTAILPFQGRNVFRSDAEAAEERNLAYDVPVGRLETAETMTAALRELLDVEETVVTEQSERIRNAELALQESNERFLVFIKEAAMRLKNPTEVIGENLSLMIDEIENGRFESKDLMLQLRIQVRNLEQIRQNIIELNKAILEHTHGLSEASKRFLME